MIFIPPFDESHRAVGFLRFVPAFCESIRCGVKAAYACFARFCGIKKRVFDRKIVKC